MTIGYLEMKLENIDVEFVVEYEYADDCPNWIESCCIVQYDNNKKANGKNYNCIDIFDLLTEEHMLSLGQQAIEDIHARAEWKQAMAEDRADAAHEDRMEKKYEDARMLAADIRRKL